MSFKELTSFLDLKAISTSFIHDTVKKEENVCTYAHKHDFVRLANVLVGNCDS